MTLRVTLRLPEPVYERLAAASRESGRSLNQVMVDALRNADLAYGPGPDASDFERLRWAMRDIAPAWTDDDDALMDEFMKEFDDGNDREITREELWARLPELPPGKSVSRAIIEDREDRF